MFSVGEIAIIISTINWPEYNGQECTIVGPLASYACWTSRDHATSGDRIGYDVMVADGRRIVVPPERLRKKPPYDGNTLTKWDDLIVWKPKEVVTV